MSGNLQQASNESSNGIVSLDDCFKKSENAAFQEREKLTQIMKKIQGTIAEFARFEMCLVEEIKGKMPDYLSESEDQFLRVVSRTNTIMVSFAQVLQDSFLKEMNKSITYHPEVKETFREVIYKLMPKTSSEWIAICEAPPDLVRLIKFKSGFSNFEVCFIEPIYEKTYRDYQDSYGEWRETCTGQKLVKPGISVDSTKVYMDAAEAMCDFITSNKFKCTLDNFDIAWEAALTNSLLKHAREHIRDIDISDPKITKAFEQVNNWEVYDDSIIKKYREAYDVIRKAQDVISELS